MAFEPTLTVFSDDAPMPRLEVFFPEFAAGTTSVDVYRLSGGREYKVRAGVRAATAGALSRIDFEVPFGVTVTYRAEMFDVAGVSLGFTDSASVLFDCADTWVHNPLNPAGGVKVAFRGNALGDISRPAQGAVFHPEGATVGKVISGGRWGITGAVLDIIVDTVEDADKFADLVGSYAESTVPVLCFRVGGPDRVRLPRPFFASVFDPREQDVTYALGGTQIAFAMTGDEVSPPSPALVVPLLTNADIDASFATNADIDAAHLRNLDIDRRYDLAGAASS